jgi:hypothetical protein
MLEASKDFGPEIDIEWTLYYFMFMSRYQIQDEFVIQESSNRAAEFNFGNDIHD